MYTVRRASAVGSAAAGVGAARVIVVIVNG
jgi:hypothetical protein